LVPAFLLIVIKMEATHLTFCWLQPNRDGDLSLPAYGTEYAAGMDIGAAVDTPVVLMPGERMLIGTGLAVAIPHGLEIQVRPRSGLAVKHGITIINSPGTIDSDYRGEIKIGLINLSNSPFTISRGDRIAQLVVAPVVRCTISTAQKLDTTERGDGGFGHTGV
jgi:dUTP pyrophosphatase